MVPPSFSVPFLPHGEALADSVLRRLDPRVKLLLLPLLVIVSFAAPSPSRLAMLLPAALLLVLLSRTGAASYLWPLYMLRWLFLCTILLHLFFTPGRTLWGIGWLSLDGLLAGLYICLQLVLAVTFSALLTRTTTPEELVAGCVSLLMPCRRLGLPVERGGALLLLVLQFIPILSEEAVRLLTSARERKPTATVDRLKGLLVFLETLLLRLVERAEALALARLAGQHPDPPMVVGAMRTHDRLVLLAGFGIIAFIWFGVA